ncbi:hypothetical protein [Roseobacter sp. MH60115]|uniref:hypothetical protein n=1 Tax=Roseobacter sp. MH60115 TaxID=2785324 RepID=UPI0018A2B1A5|nr:hypothetical protein [Roseobacter sp. MH60115]
MTDDKDLGDQADEQRTLEDTLAARAATQGEIRRSTEAEVKRLAKDAIEEWREENRFKLSDTKTWGTSAYTATIGIVVAAALVLIELLDTETSYLRNRAHAILGTEGHVKNSIVSENYDAAIGSSFDRIVDVRRQNPDTPVFKIISNSIKRTPTLLFHGQTEFGRLLKVPVSNPACKIYFESQNFTESAMVTEGNRRGAFGDLPPPVQTDGIDASAICEPTVSIPMERSLDIPFHARFYEEVAAGPHDVWIQLHIQRIDREAKTPIDSVAMRENLNHGICIVYSPAVEWHQTPASPELVSINDVFEHQGRGLWIAKLNSILEQDGSSTEPMVRSTSERLHSISIFGVSSTEGAPIPAENAPSNADERAEVAAEEQACANVKANEDQIITVRAMVYVNLDPDARL